MRASHVHLHVDPRHGLPERRRGVGREAAVRGGGGEEEARERVPREPGAGRPGGVVAVQDGEEAEIAVPAKRVATR